MATAISTGRVWTFADLGDLPDDDLTYDILGGEPAARDIPEPNHTVVLMELIHLLLRAQDAGYGEVFTSGRRGARLPGAG